MNRSQAPKEIRLQGIGVSPGIGNGEASLLEGGPFAVPRYRIAPYDVEEEVARFRRALDETREDLKGTRQHLAGDVGEEQIFILDSHLMILQDEMLEGEAIESIRRYRWNAEGALEDTLTRFQANFSRMDSEYLRDRRHDLRQVIRHLQRNLMGIQESPATQKGSPTILVAHDLSAPDLLRLNRAQVLGLIIEMGGQTSHSAITAAALGIPAVVGLSDATARIRDGDTVVLDGRTGLVTVHPTAQTLKEVGRLRKSYEDRQRALRRLRDLPCRTLDGIGVTLRANIGSLAEVATVHANGAQGVGLYRTEYLFLNRSDLPDEEEHFDIYRQVAEGVSPEPAVFRIFDLGGDVAAQTLGTSEEANPALGLRAIRLAITQEDVLRTQLRALLRTSVHAPLRILLPFISGLEEVRSVGALLRAVVAEFATEEVEVNIPPVGVMVETPAAALLADVLAREVSFFTIGTNDLIQYTLAADRGNERVSHLYDPLHPAVLRLIQGVIRTARQAGIGVSVCGEMAGDPAAAVLLVGMGVRELSMSPHSVPRVKEALRNISSAQAKAWAETASALPSAEQVHAWAEQNLRFEQTAAPPSEASVAMGRTG